MNEHLTPLEQVLKYTRNGRPWSLSWSNPNTEWETPVISVCELGFEDLDLYVSEETVHAVVFDAESEWWR